MEYSWKMIWRATHRYLEFIWSLFGSQFTTSCSGLCCVHYDITRPTCYLCWIWDNFGEIIMRNWKMRQIWWEEMRKRRDQNQRNNRSIDVGVWSNIIHRGEYRRLLSSYSFLTNRQLERSWQWPWGDSRVLIEMFTGDSGEAAEDHLFWRKRDLLTFWRKHMEINWRPEKGVQIVGVSKPIWRLEHQKLSSREIFPATDISIFW